MKAEKKSGQRESSDIHDIENMKPLKGPVVPEGMEPLEGEKNE